VFVSTVNTASANSPRPPATTDTKRLKLLGNRSVAKRG
jgi:hypothetical protein